MERVVLGIRAGQLTRSIGVYGTEHMVVGEQVIKAQFLNRPPDLRNGSRISAKLGLGVNNANLHRIQPSWRWDSAGSRAAALPQPRRTHAREAIATDQTTGTAFVPARTPPRSRASAVGDLPER
jgi:hypothetical protein